MKKFTFLTFIVFSLSFFAQAQITKGSLLLGGGINVSTNKSEDDNNANNNGKSNFVSLSPSIGLAVKDNTVAGLGFTYGHYSNKYNVPLNSQEYTTAGGNIFIRKYMPLGKRFYLFGEGGAYYNHSTNKQISGADSQTNMKTSTVSIYLYPGITYAVNRHFHLEANINNLISMSYFKSVNDNITFGGANTTTTHGFGLVTNVSSTAPLSIGFRYIIGK